MRRFLTVLLATLFCVSLSAQSEGSRRYAVNIDIQKAYVSGVCIMKDNEGIVTSSLINEFGVSAAAWQYDSQSHKVKILSLIKQMDRCAIRRTLKKDLSVVMQKLETEEGTVAYENGRYDIRYRFTPLEQ